MWFEILPSAAIITIGYAAPHVLTFVGNKLLLNNYFRRSMMDDYEFRNYLRDFRLTDNPYKVNGLEVIPDE